MTPVGRLGVAVLAGLCGTTAMTATTLLERRLRPGLAERGEPVDYDASSHVATAVGAVLHRPARTAAGRRVYFALAHWGYGSAVALGYAGIRRVVDDDVPAAAVFYVGCQAMAMTLFPTLGGTEPPWRWRRDLVVSSLAQHAVYVVTVATVDGLARRVGAEQTTRS